MKYPCKYYHLPERLAQALTGKTPRIIQRSIPVCKKFLQNACTFADCRFAHVSRADTTLVWNEMDDGRVGGGFRI